MQQLADIAVRALSPGINDPQTAIQVMDVTFVVRLSDKKFMRGHYGETDLAVCRRAIRLFCDLGNTLARDMGSNGCVNIKEHNDRVHGVKGQMNQWMVSAH